MKIIISEAQSFLLEQFGRGSANLTLDSLDYDYLDKKLSNRGRRREERIQLATNTYLERVSRHKIGIRFHATHIVTVDATNTVTLDCAGWIYSPVTRIRMEYLLNLIGYNIYRSGGETYIQKQYGDRTPYKYKDGTTILENGELILP